MNNEQLVKKADVFLKWIFENRYGFERYLSTEYQHVEALEREKSILLNILEIEKDIIDNIDDDIFTTKRFQLTDLAREIDYVSVLIEFWKLAN